MTGVEIRAGDVVYRACIGSGLTTEAGARIAQMVKGRRCALITDEAVAPLWAGKVKEGLTNAGIETLLVTVPSGEKAKSLEQAGTICDKMIAHHLDRSAFVVGLGGGVIGDVSGFVAAIYQRGIPHVQIPTTLLAMADSSIGGKTGVNTSAGKNLLGAVHHPILVLDDLDTLKTLPERERNQGFSEIIKHAITSSASMFAELARAGSPGGLTNLEELIRRNIEIKAALVALDEHDRTGQRALLNFGHTVGHGIERAGGYRQFLHGEAVSLGMVAAAGISRKRAGLSAQDEDAIVDLLNAFGLPTKLPVDFPRDQILEALQFDKKFEEGKIRFVVTPKIGEAFLSDDVTMEDIREAIETLG